MGFRVFAFDVYGTLFGVNTAHLTTELVGEQAARLRELWRTKQLQYFWVRNLLGEYADFESVTADALEVALATLGIDDAELAKRLMARYGDFQAFPDVPNTLKQLKARGARLVVHTNGTSNLVAKSLRSSGLESFFDDVISIEEVERYKPHPDAYQLLSRRLDVAPRDVCFVSSNGWDVHGAAHFGFSAAWINRFNLPDDRLPGRVAIHARSLWELVSLAETSETVARYADVD